MTITQKRDGNTLTLELKGRLDTITAPELEKVIHTELAGVTRLVMDMQELEYLSSAGLRVLLAAHKEMNKAGDGMVVKNVNEMVMEVFSVTGFADILTIEE